LCSASTWFGMVTAGSVTATAPGPTCPPSGGSAGGSDPGGGGGRLTIPLGGGVRDGGAVGGVNRPDTSGPEEDGGGAGEGAGNATDTAGGGGGAATDVGGGDDGGGEGGTKTANGGGPDGGGDDGGGGAGNVSAGVNCTAPIVGGGDDGGGGGVNDGSGVANDCADADGVCGTNTAGGGPTRNWAKATPVPAGPIPAKSAAAPKIRRIENLVKANTWSPPPVVFTTNTPGGMRATSDTHHTVAKLPEHRGKFD